MEQKCRWVLLWLVWVAAYLFGQDIILFDSISKRNLNQWYRDPPARLELHQDGRLSVRFPKHTQSQWPSIYIREKHLPGDWSQISMLELSLEALTDCRLKVRFYDQDGVIAILPLGIKAGKQQLRIPIPETAVDLSRLLDLRLLSDSPGKDVVLLIERIVGKSESPFVAQRKLFDFTRSVTGWHGRNATIVKSSWPMDPTLNCARIRFSKDTGYRYNPAVILRGKQLSSDWSQVVSLKMEVESPTGGMFYLYFVSPDGSKEHLFALNKGEHRTIVFPEAALPAIRKNIQEFHLVASRSKKDVTLLIGDPILEFYDVNSKVKELEQKLALLERICSEDSLLKKVRLLRERLNTRKGMKQLEAEVAGLERQAQFNQLKKMRGEAELSAFWTSSTAKVHRQDYHFTPFPATSVLLDCAQGESEGAQLVLFPGREFRQVSVSLGQVPVKSNGHRLAAKGLSVLPVGYVFCHKTPYYQERLGWWPDPLLSHVSHMPLEKDHYQPYFLDVEVPRGQEPGLYQGSIIVRADSISLEVPFEVQVRDFTLNPTLAYPNMFSLPRHLGRIPHCGANPEMWRRKIMDMALKHRLTPTDIYAGKPTSVEEARYLLDHGANCFNVIHCDIFAKHERERFPMVAEAMRHYRQAGIADKAYLYGWDERTPEHLPRIDEMRKRLLELAPELPVGTTTWDETFGNGTQLKDMDVWMPTIDRYSMSLDSIAQARQRGKKVWWYWAIGPHHPYPNVFIESNGVGTRLLMGSLAWKYKTDGALYYALIQWYSWEGFKKTGYVKGYMEGAPLTHWPGYSHTVHNGDGNFFYPVRQGPIGSLRLKHLRDGIDDYIAFRMLANAIGKVKNGSIQLPASWLQRAKKELEVAPEVATSLVNWSGSPSGLMAQRTRIYDLLEDYERTLKH